MKRERLLLLDDSALRSNVRPAKLAALTWVGFPGTSLSVGSWRYMATRTARDLFETWRGANAVRGRVM